MPPFFERQGTAEARHRAPTYRERWVKNDGSGTLGYFGDQRSPGNWAAFFMVATEEMKEPSREERRKNFMLRDIK